MSVNLDGMHDQAERLNDLFSSFIVLRDRVNDDKRKKIRADAKQ